MLKVRIRVAVILCRGSQVLLVEHQKDGRKYWLLPGGGVEFGESLSACAVRELKEETNLDIEVGNLAFIADSIAPDGSRHVVHVVFYAQEVSGHLQVGQEERLYTARYVDIDKLNDLVMYPPISEEIVNAVKNKQTYRPSYLGSMWID
ncbi:MAG: NUDIX domain-containing protein [Candidatus Bruticola sp.]